MSTLYKPVLIESAEQAEALPVGTMAQTYSVAHDIEVCVKDWDNAWLGTHGPGAFTDLGMVGFTALVPIEAEEEFGAGGDGMDEDFYLTRRLVTPWEAS